jgi:hypothetical protein
MPLYWTIDSKERLFTGVGEGEVTFADALSLLEAMAGEELLAVCAKIRALHEQGPVGALAMVGTQDQTLKFARLLGALAAADRPTKVFTTPRKARTWLDQQIS